MKILIVVPRTLLSDDINYAYMFPLGLAYLSSVLKQAGHSVEGFNLNHYAGSVESLLRDKIDAENKYDFVCIGGISTIYQQINMIVDAVHNIPFKQKLIMGGGIISSEPEMMFALFKPDYLVIGEGETTICELLETLLKGGDIKQVAGLGYCNTEGKLVFNRPREPILKIDLLPYPDLEGFEFEKYLDNMHPSDYFFQDLFDFPRAYPLVCSRSCPYLCTFCFHPIGNRYRQRSVDSVMKELAVMIPKYHINLISIYDELFSNNIEWLREFCARMKEFLAKLPWECKWGCQMRVDKINDEMLKMMKNSGCYMVSYGLESYSSIVLKSMKKHITPEQIDRAIKLTLKNGLSVQGNFLFGDPAETWQTAKETLDYWKKNLEAGIMLTFVNPYPGTEIYRQCLERAIIKDKTNFIANQIFDVINITEKMSTRKFAGLWATVSEARSKYRVYGVCKDLQSREDGTVELLIQCPHCRQMIEYKNYLIPSKYYYFLMMYCRSCRRRFFIASGLCKIATRMLRLCYKVIPHISYGFFKTIWPRRYLLRYVAKKNLKRINGIFFLNKLGCRKT